jgi:starch phosphorylase
VWHLNEGHAAFVVLQRIRDLIERGDSFDSALDEVRRPTVFTTHTPVPPGTTPSRSTSSRRISRRLGHARRLPRARSSRSGTTTTAAAAVQHDGAGAADGGASTRSAAARDVTREMWAPIWPDVPDDQRRCAHHQRRPRADLAVLRDRELFDDHLGRTGATRTTIRRVDAMLEIPDEELWAARQALRAYLFSFIRERARQRWKEEHVTPPRVVAPARCSIPTR